MAAQVVTGAAAGVAEQAAGNAIQGKANTPEELASAALYGGLGGAAGEAISELASRAPGMMRSAKEYVGSKLRRATASAGNEAAEAAVEGAARAAKIDSSPRLIEEVADGAHDIGYRAQTPAPEPTTPRVLPEPTLKQADDILPANGNRAPPGGADGGSVVVRPTIKVGNDGEGARFIGKSNGSLIDTAPGGLTGRATSSGAVLQAEPGVTTTVIGNFDEDMSKLLKADGNLKTGAIGQANPGGFNMLNVPDEIYERNRAKFFEKYNPPWLNNAVDRGDKIVFATRPDFHQNLTRVTAAGKRVLTGFGREVMLLRRRGFRYDPSTNTAVRMSGAP